MRSRATTIGAALLVVALAACGGGAAGQDDGAAVVAAAAPRTVAVIGDSITEQSAWAIDDYGRTRDLVTEVDATSGFMTREKQGAAEATAATRPAAAVFALGTNDAVCRLTNALISGSCRYPSFTIADMDADLTRMAETLDQPGTCVVAVNAYFGEEVGEHLDELLADGRIDGIVDWRTLATEDPSLRADGIGHLTEAGQRTFARTVIDETSRICGL